MSGKRRGFFAEMNYQAQQAEKRKRQQQAAAHRAHLAARRQAERAVKAYQHAQAAARASVAGRKAAEREAARLQVTVLLKPPRELLPRAAAWHLGKGPDRPAVGPSSHLPLR